MDLYTKRMEFGEQLLRPLQIPRGQDLPREISDKLSISWGLDRSSISEVVKSYLLSGGEWAKLEKQFRNRDKSGRGTKGEVRCQRMYDYLIAIGKTEDECSVIFSHLQRVCAYVKSPELMEVE